MEEQSKDYQDGQEACDDWLLSITYPANNPLYKTRGYVARLVSGQSNDWKMGFINALEASEDKYNTREFIEQTKEIVNNPEKYVEREEG